MSKTALLFAGQGAQVIGMGKDLADAFPVARALFAEADAALECDLSKLCFEGPESELTRTENAQPGIYLVSWVALQVLKQHLPALTFDATAGLSLGEFTALAAAGALRFEDGLQVVRLRGRLMQEACDLTRGAMAAIIGLDEAPTRELCAEAGVELANLNCPGQLVVSGDAQRVATAVELARARGARRALLLPVAGAYHSQLMASARSGLELALAGIPIEASVVPVIANVTAQPHGAPGTIRRVMVEQVTSPVRWEESIRWLLDNGFNRFIEIGPGKVLSGFMKRIEPAAQALNVSDLNSLATTIRELTPALPARTGS